MPVGKNNVHLATRWSQFLLLHVIDWCQLWSIQEILYFRKFANSWLFNFLISISSWGFWSEWLVHYRMKSINVCCLCLVLGAPLKHKFFVNIFGTLLWPIWLKPWILILLDLSDLPIAWIFFFCVYCDVLLLLIFSFNLITSLVMSYIKLVFMY